MPSFSQIGRQQRLAPGTLSQTMTLKGEANAQKDNKKTKMIGIVQVLKKGTSNSAKIEQEPLSQLTQFVTKYLL